MKLLPILLTIPLILSPAIAVQLSDEELEKLSLEQIEKTKAHRDALKKEALEKVKSAESNSKLTTTGLETIQKQLNESVTSLIQAQTEANNLRDWGIAQQDRADKAEKDVLKRDAKILKLYIAFGVIGLLIGVYLFLKFYLHLPI